MQILHRYTKAVLLDVPGGTMSEANLYRATLSGANLYVADLSGADLSGADLSGANLYGANLYGANLYGANLSRANLYGANLSRANLSRATGEMSHVKSGQLHRWPFVYTNTHLWIGCQKRTIEQWWSMSDDGIRLLDGPNGLDNWRIWKPILQQIIALSPAKPTGYVAPAGTPETPV